MGRGLQVVLAVVLMAVAAAAAPLRAPDALRMRNGHGLFNDI